jgi:hypothetical protein
MRDRPAAAHNHGMAPERIHVALELDPGADPIAGVLRPPAGEPQPFTGWLELTQLLEAIRAAGAS